MSEQKYDMRGVVSVVVTVTLGNGQVITLRSDDVREGDEVTMYSDFMDVRGIPVVLRPRIRMNIGFTEGNIVTPTKRRVATPKARSRRRG